MNSKVAIIILNWNGIHNTINCLDSLLVIDYKNYKVFLIDNGSKNNEAGKLAIKYKGKIKVIRSYRNVGYGAGVNLGINFSGKDYKHDYYLLLNNDTTVEPDFLDYLIKAINEDKQIGITGPLIYNRSKKNEILSSGGGMNWFLAKPYHKKEISEVKKPQYFITGAAMFIKKEVIDKIGNLDDRFFAYFEDTAYCLKARKSGYHIYVEPKAIIYHIHSASTGVKSNLNTYLMSRNRILFINRYFSEFYRIYFFVFNSFKSFAAILYFYLNGKNSRAYAFYKGYLDGTNGKDGYPELFAK